MIPASQGHISLFDRCERIHRFVFAVAGLAAALLTGCATRSAQSPVVSSEPRDYAIQNLTSCFARIHSTRLDGSGAEVLAEIRAGERTVVTLQPGLRLFINTHRTPGFIFYDGRPRRATKYDPVVYGEDCWKSGRVVVRRVEPTRFNEASKVAVNKPNRNPSPFASGFLNTR